MLTGVQNAEISLSESIVRPSQSINILEDFKPLDTDSEPIIVLPNILLSGKSDECKKLTEKKKAGPKCESPDLTPKPIPPYDYGYCKEPTPPPRMSCPPKAVRSNKGPCCHETGDKVRGGCKNK
ncbi:hypothetical protein O3M35_000928 [Rhynocoris fuscipes]|uniref:Uncharacterized protein n=1 Tax=Rhynocoris fuscipes TaxID=488301 RepID=A0AAW1DR47_9HEMI